MGADTITNGPPTSAECFGSEGLILDATNNVLYTYGATRTPVALNAAQVTNPLQLGPQTALTAITTAQTLLSLLFGAGALNVVGTTITVKGKLIYSTTSANVATISLVLKLGGVTLCTITTAATNTAASTNLPIQFTFTAIVTATGASGTLIVNGVLDADIGTAAAADVATYLDTNTAVSSAVNLLTAETLTLTIAGSAAVPSAQLLNATIQVAA